MKSDYYANRVRNTVKQIRLSAKTHPLCLEMAESISNASLFIGDEKTLKEAYETLDALLSAIKETTKKDIADCD